MNLVETLNKQFNDAVTGKLGSLLGEGAGKTRSVLEAALPSLLAGLSKMTGGVDGAEKLAATAGKFEPELITKFPDMTKEQAGAVLDEGNAAVQSLFGNDTVSALIAAIARYTDLSPEKVKKLLGYLVPLVLSALNSQLQGKTSAAGLVGLFADQKQQLANALPAGLSLDQVPGIGKPAGESGSVMNMVATILIVALLAVAGWYLVQKSGVLQPQSTATSAAKK